jgi:Swt1-like HEPN
VAITNNERVGKGLALLAQGVAPFVERECSARYGEGWVNLVGNGPVSKTDAQFLLKVMVREWNEVFARA